MIDIPKKMRVHSDGQELDITDYAFARRSQADGGSPEYETSGLRFMFFTLIVQSNGSEHLTITVSLSKELLVLINPPKLKVSLNKFHCKPEVETIEGPDSGSNPQYGPSKPVSKIIV
ncbi:hypothetical protein RvY_13301 [Ramazzottius varieornatus]|uniref:Uncharacterized protein n=1 Tax=Ramazzottius varieornatus TaxID=947166 RepID=A0A1D1VMG0_RAMVA|nr:hypothetical protein RvY_13301 [Ramazzottius varieornatus]